MILFLVYTKSQLFNAIVLSQTEYKDEQCDIYFRVDIARELNMESILKCFSNCYEMPYLDDKYKSRVINRIINGINQRWIADKLPSNPYEYSEVLYSGKDYRVLEIYYVIKARNKKIKLSIFEEGINEYYCYSKTNSFVEEMYSRLFFGRYYINDISKLYLYSPKFANIIFGFSVKKIPKFIDNSFIVEILNKTFCYVPSPINNKSVQILFIDQIFDRYGYDENYYDLFQKRILGKLESVFGSENTLIKLHPRSRINKYGANHYYFNVDYPFEILALNEKLDKVILVSVCSSSVLTIKWIFDIEPYTISLNKLTIKDEAVNKLFSSVQRNSNEKRFYIPTNITEIDTILEEIVCDIKDCF